MSAGSLRSNSATIASKIFRFRVGMECVFVQHLDHLGDRLLLQEHRAEDLLLDVHRARRDAPSVRIRRTSSIPRVS